MNKPKLSVCIPVYNCGEYIKECIDSVLSQCYKNFELVILDNQSTDNTVSVINSFTDDRIRFYQNETNIGMLKNWNKVLSYAQGEYIKVLPADDFLYPESLMMQCKVLDEDKEKKIALVCGRKNVINDKGRTLFTRGFSKKAGRVDGVVAINKTIRSGGNIIGEPGVVLFRKSILEKSGEFDASIYYVMDLYMWFKMLLHGDLFVIPEIVCSFRISSASESTRIVDKQKKDVDDFIKKIYMDQRYRIKPINFRIALFKSFLSALAKKIIYKTVLR